MNQYISKLFESVGSLVYEEAPETEKYNFMITGVQSELGGETDHYLFFSLGYDLCQVNQYISKLFENVGSLVYEEAPETEKYNFMITGVQSELGGETDHYLLFSLGYDLCQVNQYISKLFENVGSLVQRSSLRAIWRKISP